MSDSDLKKRASDVDRERAYQCVTTMLSAFRLAAKTGGPKAMFLVADIVTVIEAFQSGDMDDGAPITGPFYPEGIQ